MAEKGIYERVPKAVEDIQVNFCRNPKCPNFGVPASTEAQPRGPGAKDRGRDAYEKDIHSKTAPVLVCLYCREEPALKSNLGIYEEFARFRAYLAPRPTMACPKKDCQSHKENFAETQFQLFGKTRSGSQRFRCKVCGTVFSIAAPTNRQRVPHKNLTVFRLLVNKMPFRRICEVANISPKTLYRKIDFIHRQCILFAGNRERTLPEKLIRRLYVGVDRQDYTVNWTSSADRRNVQLGAVAAADNATGYVFATHLNFDPSVYPRDIEKETRTIGDYSKDPPFRRYARLWTGKDYFDSLQRRSGDRLKSGKGSLMNNITLAYEDAAERADSEMSEAQDEDTMLPLSGMQVHAEYTLYGHFFFLRKLFENVEKVRFFLDQDSGIRGACLTAFCDRIKQARCDAFYVRIESDISIDEKRSILADSRRKFAVMKALHPDLKDSQVKLLTIKEKLKDLKAVGKWNDRWVEHPFPNMGEPEKAMCYLTDMQEYDEDHVAWLYNKASLHAVDRFFMQVRRRLSLLERPISSASNTGRRWYGYGPYNPAMVAKLLDIFRVFYNYVEVGKDKQTPAMRLGLARNATDPGDIMHYTLGDPTSSRNGRSYS